MTTRSDIYYWKCDSAQSAGEKTALMELSEGGSRELLAQVRAACDAALGHPVDAVAPFSCEGNHFAFLVDDGGHRLFFRGDAAPIDDEYLLAESALLKLAGANGVPVPAVFHTDISRSRFPFRFQILGRAEGKALHHAFRDGTLSPHRAGRMVGELLLRVHAIPLEGFGFINTGLLETKGALRGLDASYPDYFFRRLEEHARYLVDHAFLPAAETSAIVEQLEGARPLLTRSCGSLTHRDPALWNVLGTPERITALIDWDDAVSGDPADDLGMLGCFYGDDFMGGVWESYGDPPKHDATLRIRTLVHTLRNMLWKAKLRHALGYFQKNDAFFLNSAGGGKPLKDLTLEKIRSTAAMLREEFHP